MSKKFSIIVPIYKVERYVRKCIDSILAQTFADFELLLIDDGSPDHCPEICDEYAVKDNRVIVIHKENAGLVAARNTGIKAAKGDYICYVDGDDWIEPELLDTIVKKGFLIYDSDIYVFGAKKVFENREEVIDTGPAEGIYDKNRLIDEVYPYMMYDNRKPFCTGLIFPAVWNKIYKRNFLLNHYCNDERIRMGEDNAFVFECLFESESVVFINDVLYSYNQLNSGSMAHSYDPNRFYNNQWLTEYISLRMGGKNSVIDNQINAFKAHWLIAAVYYEIKCNRKPLCSARHIRDCINNTKVLEGINNQGLPASAVLFIALLRLRLYLLALLGAKIISIYRQCG